MFSDKKMYEAGIFSNAYDRIESLGNEYLYETWYSKLDYDFGNRFYKENQYPLKPAACTSICKGNLFGRNYDWTCDEIATFVVHTEANAGRHATLGIATYAGLTKDVVKKGGFNKFYKVLPFPTVDGINDKGLTISTNVVPSGIDDNGLNEIVNENNSIEVCSACLVRYLLDNCASIDEVKDTIDTKLKIYTPKSLVNQHYAQHYLVSHKNEEGVNEAIVIEFINGKAEYKDNGTDTLYMTNFHLIYGDDKSLITGKVSTPADEIRDTRITAHGAGLERFNIVVDDISTVSSVDAMKDLLEKLKYTNFYKGLKTGEEKWLSELVGDYPGGLSITNSSPLEDFNKVGQVVASLWNEHDRSGTFWQTVHSSIYDTDKKELTLVSQENFGETYKFTL